MDPATPELMAATGPCLMVLGDGERYAVPQKDLEELAGGQAGEGERRLVAALLAPDPSNPQDKDAVAVKIEKRHVGYLRRDAAPVFLKALADGGFDCAASAAAIISGAGGSFDVRLDAVVPFRLHERAPNPDASGGQD